MRGKYMTADSVRNAVRSAGARDYLDQTAAEAGKKSKYKGIWYYQTGRAIQKDWMPRPEWSAVVVAPPAAAGKAPPKMIDIYRVGEPPFFAIHAFESEVEAALAYDYATLWLLLRSKGCTDSKLRNHRWNLPQLKLWQRPAVKWLAACGLEEVNAVQKYVRNKVRGSMQELLERGLLTKERAQSFKRQQERLQEWRSELTQEGQREAAAKQAAWREKERLAARRHAQRERNAAAASWLLKKLLPKKQQPTAAQKEATRKKKAAARQKVERAAAKA